MDDIDRQEIVKALTRAGGFLIGVIIYTSFIRPEVLIPYKVSGDGNLKDGYPVEFVVNISPHKDQTDQEVKKIAECIEQSFVDGFYQVTFDQIMEEFKPIVLMMSNNARSSCSVQIDSVKVSKIETSRVVK